MEFVCAWLLKAFKVVWGFQKLPQSHGASEEWSLLAWCFQRLPKLQASRLQERRPGADLGKLCKPLNSRRKML